MPDMTSAFLNTVLPNQKDGYLITAIGQGPHLDKDGKYCHRKWVEKPFPWPGEAVMAVDYLQYYATTCDVYVCPYLMKTPERKKGNAAYRALMHCDVDTMVDPVKVAALDGFVVWSGTPGHGHVYAPLAWPVTPVQHEILCRGLAVHLGGDPAKVSDNDVLRPPGTFNHKPTAITGGPMAFVTTP
jgi:hypothetical protein